MNLSFENKVALVTGAGSGMGLAAAQAFAAESAAVALVDINESAVRTAAERLVAADHKAIAIRSDVTDEAQVKAMVEQTVSAFGRLDATPVWGFPIWLVKVSPHPLWAALNQRTSPSVP